MFTESDEVNEIISQVKTWKERVTAERGAGVRVMTDISMFGDETNTYMGDITFPAPIQSYDLMLVGMGLCSLVLTTDIRYLSLTYDSIVTDGTHQEQVLLIMVSDIVGGRVWASLIPYTYCLGNKIEWGEQKDDAPDPRSLLLGMMLLPAVVRSQSDLLAPTTLKDATSLLVRTGLTVSFSEGTSIGDRIASGEDLGEEFIPGEMLREQEQAFEERIRKATEDIPDSPDDWINGTDG